MAAPSSSVLRALEVCEALGQHQPIGVRELSRLVEVPRSSALRALESLEAAGWAVRTNGMWSLSLRPAVVGLQASGLAGLRGLAAAALNRLSALSNESVRLWIREGDRVVLVESRESAQPVRFVSPPPGASLPLHAAASGKAILAHLPRQEIEEILALPLAAVAAHTITDPARLREDLATVRSRGYAMTSQEAGDDIGGVAAAITDPSGTAVAAVSIALPMHRLTDAIVANYGGAAAAEARGLSAELAGSLRAD